MDIFLSGDLTTYALHIARRLLDEGHTVVVVSSDGFGKTIKHKHLIVYDTPADDALFSEIFVSHAFEAVIYCAKQYHPFDTQASQPKFASLESILENSTRTGVEKFILLSSIEVYGLEENLNEEETPVPSTAAGQILINAENLCQFYGNNGLHVSIVRFSKIYGGENDQYSILSHIIKASKEGGNVEIPFGQQEHCNFLHVDDLIALLSALLKQETRGGTTMFNLGTEDINFDFLSQQFNLQFPNVSYRFAEQTSHLAQHQKVVVSNAERKFGWKAKHHLMADLPIMARSQKEDAVVKPPHIRLKMIAEKLKPFLVWVEMLLGGFLMHMLTVWTNTIIEFKVIDYRLIYVVIIGSIHGLLFGLIAAILAAASAVFSWHTVGLDFALLIYNVENWIPFALYFLAGAMTGYVHDKQENEIQFERNQSELIHEKYAFLYSLYNEISRIKNRLRDQLVGYRDSFGRFFRIASELNELEEDNIFFKALEILEELMKNDQIAIYSIESGGHFGRLQVSSKSITREIPKSMRLDDFSEALDILRAGDIFQNKNLIPNYPAYIAPIQNEGNLIGLVTLWEAKFEQFNLYYFNLFKIITGLIQSALVRATTFENAQYKKIYLPSTRIMRPEPFRQAFNLRKKMRRNKVSQFQLLSIKRIGLGWDSLFDQLSRCIRNEDIIGILDENADECYVILSNAAEESVGMIQTRMKDNGILSTHIHDLEIN